ncbi:hypothetical protein C8R44DRAFT_353314 [Mycena epipterygia]|nr:hypothetical protein C8R44DRAFT_353314 [Mycena epipterygia]
MDDSSGEHARATSPTGAVEQRAYPSPSGGKEFPFPPFPPANSSTLNDTFSGSLRNREGEHTRHKPRSRSQSRSASSISNLLLVATERLGQETNRANALDLRCAEVLSHLRTIIEDRDQLRRTLTKVQEELSLYKLQLDVAQNEIFRAQKIVDGVDKARVEAEEQAAKDRTLARQLVSERAVWVAREEGRNEGFEEGLRQGRRLAFAAAHQRADEYTDDYDEVDEDPARYEASLRNSPPSNRQGWSSPSRSVRSVLPDAASYTPTLPVHAASASNAPPTQSHQPAFPRPPSAPYPERSSSARSSRPLPRAPAHSPEPIDIRSYRSATRAPSRAPSPSMSHRSVAPPPDGFIPTVGADSVIFLPPPHELSRPVSFVDEDTLRTPGGANTPNDAGRLRTMSNASRGSTRISEYDILGPPRAARTPVTRSDKVAHDWRVANPDPPEHEQRQTKPTDDSTSSENLSPRSSTPRSQVSRRNGPRRPREIVMPMPLSTTMHSAGMSYTRPSTTAPSRPDPQTSQPNTAGTSYAPASRSYGAPASTSYAAPASTSYAAPASTSYAAPALTSYAPPDTSQGHSSQGHSDDTTPARPRSTLAWIKTRFNRSFSASSVPNIEIEPPSNSASNTSTSHTVNTILLAPDDAGHVTLPQQFVPELAGALAGVQAAQGDATNTGNTIILPDSQLPPGFVPLSPILPNLHSMGEPAPAATPSPQPPAYSPRDIYAAPPRPATAAGTVSRARSPQPETGNGSGSGRARGASIGSAMLQTSPAPLNRPISIFSDA